jgi:hypothetical protein
MISQLLGKISGFFDKDFLFASFLPALLLIGSLAVTVVLVAGPVAVWEEFTSGSIGKDATVLAASGLFVVVLAYILNALRPVFLSFWSGDLRWFPFWGFLMLARKLQRKRFLRMRRRAQRDSPWGRILADFESRVREEWQRRDNVLSSRTRVRFQERASGFNDAMAPESVERQLNTIASAFRLYSGEDLSDSFETAKRWLIDREETEQLRIQTDTAEWDRAFPRSVAAVRPTDLGNVIAAYEQYPSTRYEMEAEVFWPRLRKVIDKEYLPLVLEPRILLDFSLTTATLAAVYGLLALFAGPWLWLKPAFWITLALFAFVVALLFYRLGIVAAVQLGAMVRSSFDLFRLDLLKALRLPHPATTREERERWRQCSQLIVYGQDLQPGDFELRPEK